MSAEPRPKEGAVHLRIDAGVADVIFDRPGSHNAMTWPMYERLLAICESLETDRGVRAVRFRGAGGRAFVAGTDIAQFQAFRDGEDGVAYERRIDACISRIERLPMPTLAVCEGWVMGGGLIIAAACDLRLASATALFGVPIAKTLGNCLSRASVARLVAAVGAPNAKRMLLLADALTAQEGLTCGFVSEVVAVERVDSAADALVQRLASHAPLTMRAAKESIRRLSSAVPHEASSSGDDLVRLCYGSADFKEGVAAFVGKRRPEWSGR